MTDTVAVSTFERQVLDIEGIQIIVRASRGAYVKSYSKEPRHSSDTSACHWLFDYVRPLILGYEVQIIRPRTCNLSGSQITLGDLRK